MVAPEFAAVRDRVRQDWEDERRRVFNEEYYARLRDRYEIVIEELGPEADYAAANEEVR